MRQIVLDTETTGLEVELGHRVIELGCIELKNRRPTGNDCRHFFNPGRVIDPGAIEVHGITNEFLADKPVFGELAQEIWRYLEGAELIIHNASFDLGFLNSEFERAGIPRRLQDACSVTDTVALARKLHPGQRVSLDALCRRYGVDNSGREFHGAQLDARLLADVYLAMTGGQSRLVLDDGAAGEGSRRSRFVELLGSPQGALPLAVVSDAELAVHRERLEKIRKKAGRCLWETDLA